MNTAQRTKPTMLESFRNSTNLLLWVVRFWAISLEMFLHRNIGERYLGFQAFGSLLLMSAYSLCWPHYDLRPFSWFMFLYIAMWIKARWENFTARRHGEVYHSRYTGWPSCVGPETKFGELTAKRYVEPGVTMAFGVMLCELWGERPLGTFLMIASACLFLSVRFTDVVERARQMDLDDAVIEQEAVADQFRRRHGNDV